MAKGKKDSKPVEGKDEKGRFTLGHLWSLGNKGGAPPMYKTYQEVHDKITEYLQWEESASKGKYTISGLALFMGFATRQSIEDTKNRDAKFSYVIDRFKLFLTHYHEQKLTWAGSFQGSFVWLKNYGGYLDEVTQHQHQTITTVQPVVKDTGQPFASSEDQVK